MYVSALQVLASCAYIVPPDEMPQSSPVALWSAMHCTHVLVARLHSESPPEQKSWLAAACVFPQHCTQWPVSSHAPAEAPKAFWQSVLVWHCTHLPGVVVEVSQVSFRPALQSAGVLQPTLQTCASQ